ncbi:hypothetical protein [Xenorhabdus sp. SGI246]|uniref:hypothetical protein n=1 Tax=Xenorhabdus sp. SGI246 TaxID=3158263 RepID=UPI00349FB928
MAITDSWSRSTNNKLQERVITKSDRGGLSVRMTPKGKLYFNLGIIGMEKEIGLILVHIQQPA